MKLNVNSWHCKLYCTIYGLRPTTWTYDHALPKNLCQYFWKLLFCLLLAPLHLPFFWLGSFILDRKNKGDKERKYRYNTHAEIWGTGLLYTLAACMIVSMIWFPFLPFNSTKEDPHYILHVLILLFGGLGYACLTILIILFIRANYLEWRDERRAKRGVLGGPKQPSMIKEIIKAWYYKYCPRLEWRDGTKIHTDEEW